jgi:TetR/AcrR family transcriptional regulator, regulator of autoinduction and epiphytic fitness
MVRPVNRVYDNSRRQAQARATRLRILEAAKTLFIERGYSATTLEAIADAADASLPTLYRLFSSKRELLKAVLDVSFAGDDEPVAFGNRPDVQAARTETDPQRLIKDFAAIARQFMTRSGGIMRVLASASEVDSDVAGLMNDIRRQRRTGQSRIVNALAARDALDPRLELSEAVDITYAVLSPEVYHLLTVERGWTGEQYERWIERALRAFLVSKDGIGPQTVATGE